MTQDNYPEATYEEIYNGYTIYIENNADPYRGGYEYTVAEGSDELESGLVFSIEEGVKEAKVFIDSL